MATQQDSVIPATLFLGRVKWFNNSTGYGFITVTEGERFGSDIFVHHSSITVENQQYKYLVQGEYVNFVLTKSTSGPHEYQATQVVGVNGGKLMCETRREFKIARNTYREQNGVAEPKEQQTVPSSTIKQRRAPRTLDTTSESRVRGEGPRGKGNDRKEWTLVKPLKKIEKRGAKKEYAEEK
jgi:CspA family cold shock protein